MKIVCCANMPYAKEAFSTLGDILVKDGRKITAEDVRDAEILAIRSTTNANRALLEGSRVRFVGTATIGTDHMEIPWYEERGIKWCYAPGCNANSVSEYITAALLCLANRHGFSLAGKTVGVIGVGNVGRLVVKKAEALGMNVLANDPPKEDAPETANERKWTSLDELLARADVVTFHVPLTKGGRYPTFHMADKALFGKIKHGAIFMNMARGAVLVTDELLNAMHNGVVSHAVIDTWEGEPAFRKDLLGKVDIGTPHIAGHSFEGKVNGTVMVYQEACRFLGVDAGWSPEGLLPAPIVPEVKVDAAGRSDEQALWEIVRKVYDIEADDRAMRQCGDDAIARAAHFDKLRKNYPVRREFRFTRVSVMNASPSLSKKVSTLGFSVR